MSKFASIRFSSVAFALAISMVGVSAFSQEVNATSPVQSVPAATPSAADVAKKLGGFVGSLFKAPLDIGKAFASGISAGISSTPTVATPQKVDVAVAPAVPTAQASVPSSLESLFSFVNKQFQRPASEPLAPVEDRSITAQAETPDASR